MNNLITQVAVAKVDEVGDKTNNLVTNVTNILNAIIAVLGLVCVVVMLVGGINYITSAGDTSKVEKGKKTILYGLIGLIISVLAFAIVNWVIVDVIGGAEGGGENQSQTQSSQPAESGSKRSGHQENI